ncbi:MAG: hypothetical protein LBQ00_01820 [Syntrophobacterales bacterium]|nr:hypothetical protein [Syntrophobacterales bacterium]
MQARLEDVLEEKERGLKLYQRFLDLKDLCEQDVFPSINLPLKEHVENLKSLVERIIPDPRDRKEELFSGEIFALLGALYLHDTGLTGSCRWFRNGDIFNALDSTQKRILVNNGIARELGIPEKAIEIINYLSFSDILKKMPMEWVITEGGNKALIRNTKVIEHLFNFSHFLLDVFFADLDSARLRRYQRPRLILGKEKISLEISSREGVVRVGYTAESPYETHQIEKVKVYVEKTFEFFKNNVNGRLGFQYRRIEWDINCKFDDTRLFCGRSAFSPYAGREIALIERWTEASSMLDRVFDHGCAIVVGDEFVGKSTMLKSFVLSQAATIFTNAFYCEVWANPVSELRDRVCSARMNYDYSDLDIISLCSRLLDEGTILFILDGFERTAGLDQKEREKLARFLDFCFAREHCYVIVSGDKGTFFEWSAFFSRTAMSALYELKPLDSEVALRMYGQEANTEWDKRAHYTPAECELFVRGITIEAALKDIFVGLDDINELRAVLNTLIDVNERHLKRYTADDICFESYLPSAQVLQHLDLLTQKGLVLRDESSGSAYFSLRSRFLMEPLFNILELKQFEGKKKVREILKWSSMDDSLLNGTQLDLIRACSEGMAFSKEDMGRILASLISAGENYQLFVEKARRDSSGINIQPILKLMDSNDVRKRADAIRLLLDLHDKKMVNPLLMHLKKESVQELKDLIVIGIGSTGKRRRIIALMRTLKENGDRELRFRAIGFFRSLLRKNPKNLLADIIEMENDPVILEELEKLLSTQET